MLQEWLQARLIYCKNGHLANDTTLQGYRHALWCLFNGTEPTIAKNIAHSTISPSSSNSRRVAVCAQIVGSVMVVGGGGLLMRVS
jgi:hypothetical protein